VVGACVAVAALSLLAPIAVTYDAWGWLIWGRELWRGALDTTAGPSWKPLPVVATVFLAPLGTALAPALWLVLARTLGLLALVAVFRLAARWGGAVAGAVAVVALLLTPDRRSPFARLLLEGHTAPLTVTFALWAIIRHLDGHRTQALVLGTCVALLRPEAWPFLVVYAGWLWWRRGAPRPVVATAILVVPVLWFGGDWLGSGSPWNGADIAQIARGSDASRLELALTRASNMVVDPVWVAVLIGVVVLARRRQWTPLALAALAAGWSAVVIAMCVGLRYAALGRFYLVAAALFCVIAGIGVAEVVAGVRRRSRVMIGAAVVLVASLPLAWPRVRVIDDRFEDMRARSRFERGLDPAIDAAGGRDALLACGRIGIQNHDLATPARPALAWKLDLPLAGVASSFSRRAGTYFAQTGSRYDAALAAASGTARPIGGNSTWTVYAIDC
jgi:hypothetical protein